MNGIQNTSTKNMHKQINIKLRIKIQHRMYTMMKCNEDDDRTDNNDYAQGCHTTSVYTYGAKDF